jgi:hypothetical protein
MARAVLLPTILAVSAVATAALAQPPVRGTFVRECDPYTLPIGLDEVGRADVRAGRAWLVGFRRTYERMRARDVPRDAASKRLKAPIAFKGARPVVVEVPPARRRELALEYGGDDEFARVRLEPCIGMRATIAPGRLAYSGRWRRCVPLRLNGRRVLLPLGRRCR